MADKTATDVDVWNYNQNLADMLQIAATQLLQHQPLETRYVL